MNEFIDAARATPAETFIVISALIIVAVILYRRKRRRPIAIRSIVAKTDNFKFVGDIHDMELKEGFHIDITIKPKTAHGHAAAIDPNSVQLSSTNPAVIGIGANPEFPDDPLKFRISGLDGSNAESAGLEWRADGDTGEGVRPVVWSGSAVCTQGNAVVAEAEIGEPVEDEPEAQPAPAEDQANSGTGSEATGSEPIAGEDADAANSANPVAGSEADSAKPAGEDVS